MRFDWQKIAAALLVLAALLYVTRRAWSRLRSMLPGTPASSGDGCGSCGTCGDEGAKPRPVTPQAEALIQIGRTRGGLPRT
jgi:hypothetical protein